MSDVKWAGFAAVIGVAYAFLIFGALIHDIAMTTISFLIFVACDVVAAREIVTYVGRKRRARDERRTVEGPDR